MEDSVLERARDEALGLLVELGGVLADEATDSNEAALPAQWQARIDEMESPPAEELAREALERARSFFEANPRMLYRCRGPECLRRDPNAPPVVPVGVGLCETGCQGHCEAAPRATLCFEGMQRALGGLDQEGWQRVAELTARVADARSLLIEDDPAQDWQFDPVHAHASPDMSAFAFLVGHFRGEGHYGAEHRSFRKEVVGRWVAGGGALALRMEVAYPLPRGGIDSHQALVVIGAKGEEGSFAGRAWTDAGSCLEYRYRIDAETGALVFADRPPGHGHSARSARKLLIPDPRGYEERLEVETDTGEFSVYSSLVLERV